MIKNYVLIKKLYYNFFLSLSNRLQKAVTLFLFLLCFSSGLNISISSKSGIKLFPAVFAESAGINKEQAAKAVWEIQMGDISSGSGFFISENKIVTNFHVIENAESIGLEDVILVQEGNPNQLKVKRISALSIVDDLAILEIEGAVSDFLSLPSEDLNASKNLYALGYPLGRFQEIKQAGALKENLVFVNHSKLSGVSGGPVLNESHQLAGVAERASDNLLAFISVQTLKSFIELEHCKNLRVKECFILSREIFKKSIQSAKGMRDFYKIAIVFYEGEGGGQNLFKAREWFEKSAEQDYAPAQYNLALMYYKGGGEQNLFKAGEWFEKSANQGYSPAQYNLALMYYKGEGVEQDLFKARELMEESANQGYASARFFLALVYYEGEGGEQNLFKARELMEESANQGYARAQFFLALMYYKGRGGEQNLFKAREWFEKSANQGDVEAQFFLALMYYEGEGGGQNLFKAREWFEKSANQGYIEAQFFLAVMYYKGKGGGQDFFKAREWFEKSANQGYAPAQYSLAVMYYKGEGGEQDFFKAGEWFEKSAN